MSTACGAEIEEEKRSGRGQSAPPGQSVPPRATGCAPLLGRVWGWERDTEEQGWDRPDASLGPRNSRAAMDAEDI